MSQLLLQLHITYRTILGVSSDRLREEIGEGVISTAIAVLIMALLGAGMWLAFSGIFDGASSRTSTAVDSIGG